jgi:hypothetical protein
MSYLPSEPTQDTGVVHCNVYEYSYPCHESFHFLPKSADQPLPAGKHEYIVTYRVCVMNIMGFGFGEWIYWHIFKITINFNSSQSMARICSFPYWTKGVFSSTVMNGK